MAGTLLKLLVGGKLLRSGNVPVNAELRPLSREKRGTEVQRYGTLKEAMKMWWDNFQFPHKTVTHNYIIHSYLSFPCPREAGFNGTERPCNKEAPGLGKPLLPPHTGIWVLSSPCTLPKVGYVQHQNNLVPANPWSRSGT